MRVLHVLNTGKFSGAENVVCQIINMFKGDPEYNMAYCSYDGEIRNALENRNINFFPVTKMEPQEIKRIIDLYKPDVIHAHDMKAGFTVARACGKIPMISHIHNNAFNSRGISLKSLAYYYAAKKAKKIIWVSKSSFEGYAFHKAFQEKSIVLYNVIDQNELFQRMKEDQRNYDYDVVYVGRITYQKNPQRLLNVVRLACDKMPNLKVAIVGTGELDDEIKSLCKDLHLEGNVSFLGFQSNPLKMLYDSKVMIMTSRWEGTPMVALEAMALGVPIISTPTDGMNELIENGVNGYLADDDTALSDKIVKIVSDTVIREYLRKNQLSKSAEVNNVENYKKILADLYARK